MIKSIPIDFDAPGSITSVGSRLAALGASKLDYVVNAVGADVRKPFDRHEGDEVNRLVTLNFTAAADLLRVLLPFLSAAQASSFIQIAGFMNARVAFPYYAFDVATRSAMRTLLEAMQRELIFRTAGTCASDSSRRR